MSPTPPFPHLQRQREQEAAAAAAAAAAASAPSVVLDLPRVSAYVERVMEAFLQQGPLPEVRLFLPNLLPSR